jgi:hypothetical protein
MYMYMSLCIYVGDEEEMLVATKIEAHHIRNRAVTIYIFVYT